MIQRVAKEQRRLGESALGCPTPSPVISCGTSSTHFHSVNGLCCSLQNNMQADDGSYVTDVDMTVKAMRRTVARNLDAQETLHSPSL